MDADDIAKWVMRSGVLVAAILVLAGVLFGCVLGGL